MSIQARKRLGVKRYDTADYLRNDEDALLYLQACAVEAGDDAAFIAKALGTVVRARGAMAAVAEKAGLSRESLYKALSGQRDPSFSTVLKVLSGLDLHITFAAQEQRDHAEPWSEPGETFGPSSIHENMVFIPVAGGNVAPAMFATRSDALRQMFDLSTSGQSTAGGTDTTGFDIVFDCSDFGTSGLKGKNVLSGATSGRAAALPVFASISSSYQH